MTSDDELYKIYDNAIGHIDALRAVARYSAEKQRASIDLSRYVNGAEISAGDMPHVVIQKLQKNMRAMQSAAPLWVDVPVEREE